MTDKTWLLTLCYEALIEEVALTPKPGLVDLAGSGAHEDMDASHFFKSAHALWEPFSACIDEGVRTHRAEELLHRLRPVGMEGERAMLAATGGVNTHKGMVFSLGLLMGAAGWLWGRGQPVTLESLIAVVQRATQGLVESDLEKKKHKMPRTAGERLYQEQGFLGIRGEVQAGFFTVRTWGLPVFRAALDKGCSREEASHRAFLSLLFHAEDSNLMKRGGPALYRQTKERAGRLLSLDHEALTEALVSFDHWCIQHHLSPGGTADLLALTFFFDGILRKSLPKEK